jgi:hypothetical protein
MADIPVVVTTQGAQPTPPATLNADLIALVASINPGYTILPGGLIEDLSSTATYALVVTDSARVELLNSITPFSANEFMLWQLGQIYLGPGAAPAVPTNTSVYVTFTAEDSGSNPLSGQLIPVGFTASDGTYQYIVQDGGVTATDGQTVPLFCQATIAGQWAVPTGTVTQIVTAAPPNVTITCTNLTPGISGAVAETEEEYRARVLQAGQAVATGTPQLLKTLLGLVPGIQQRLISVRQQTGGFWEVICGGGDPYLTAQAIYDSGLNVAGLVGSTLAITAITQAFTAQITTAINHGYLPGQQAVATGIVGMVPLNGLTFTVETVIDEKNFTINVNTTFDPVYVSGGVLTPNLRDVTASIYDYPDVYQIVFVDPPQQTVTITITYATISTNFVSEAAMSQAGAPAVAAYVNSVVVGQPMSLLELQAVFLAAVASILDASLFSSLVFAVSIAGVATPPTGDLFIGDPESSFEATTGGITILAAA